MSRLPSFSRRNYPMCTQTCLKVFSAWIQTGPMPGTLLGISIKGYHIIKVKKFYGCQATLLKKSLKNSRVPLHSIRSNKGPACCISWGRYLGWWGCMVSLEKETWWSRHFVHVYVCLLVIWLFRENRIWMGVCGRLCNPSCWDGRIWGWLADGSPPRRLLVPLGWLHLS